LIFDFRKSLREAQRAIYDRMMSFRLLKNQLSEIVQKQDAASEVSQSESAESKSGPLTDGKDNPLHIVKVRFAKGEITKKEYDEMWKLLGSYYGIVCVDYDELVSALSRNYFCIGFFLIFLRYI
jgi:hypothetical protein